MLERVDTHPAPVFDEDTVQSILEMTGKRYTPRDIDIARLGENLRATSERYRQRLKASSSLHRKGEMATHRVVRHARALQKSLAEAAGPSHYIWPYWAKDRELLARATNDLRRLQKIAEHALVASFGKPLSAKKEFVRSLAQTYVDFIGKPRIARPHTEDENGKRVPYGGFVEFAMAASAVSGIEISRETIARYLQGFRSGPLLDPFADDVDIA